MRRGRAVSGRFERPSASSNNTLIVVLVLAIVALVGVVSFLAGSGSPGAAGVDVSSMSDEELADAILRQREESVYARMRASGITMSDDEVKGMSRMRAQAIPGLAAEIHARRAMGARDEELRREYRERTR